LLLLLSTAPSAFAFQGVSFYQNGGRPSQQLFSVAPTSETATTVETTSLIKASPGKAAVILNTNARAVSKKVERMAKEVFVSDEYNNSVFVTTTAEEAKAAAKAIMNDPEYQVVVPVGGDGTLTAAIQYMVEAAMQQQPGLTVNQAISKMPVIGYVPLGTGNGVGSVVGCTLNRIRRKKKLRKVLESLKQVAATSTRHQLGTALDDMEADTVELPIMQVSSNNSSDLCFFAGVGFDSLMLNDYKDIKAWSKKTGFLPTLLSSVAGYCVALVVKTLPNSLLYKKHNIQVKVSTPNPESTLWVDHRRGDFVQKCHSETLFEGETGILAAATAPFYGGGMRLFPFARLTVDKMHLRLGRISPMTGFLNIPRIFAGSYRDKTDSMGVLDFVGSEFEVTIKGTDGKGFPLQHSGESVGDVEQFQLKVMEEPVRFISFLKKR